MNAAGPQSSHADGVEDTIRDFWASRPRRPRSGRKAAGVAAGIGYRYGIDPVLVRVLFVVATVIGGFGILLYLLGWLFLPDERDTVSAVEALFGKGRSHMSHGFTIVLCLACLPASGMAFGGTWMRNGGFVMLGLAAVGLFLLHRNRGHLNRPPRPQAQPTPAAPAAFTAHDDNPDVAAVGSDPVTGFAPDATEDDHAGSDHVPSDERGAGRSGWDPLGAAPLGWDLPDAGPNPDTGTPSATSRPPEPAPASTPAKRRSKVTSVTFGLALLTAAAGVVLNLLGMGWFSPAHIIGLTLGVLGLGLVTGAFVGGGKSLTLLALPLAIAGIALTTLPLSGLPGGGMGEIRATPQSAEDVRPVYERTMGKVELDLTQLPADTDAVHTTVRTGMGETVVTVPPDADVTYTCSNTMGNMDCLGKSAERAALSEHSLTGTETGPDGDGGTQITLDVSSNMGNVKVHRG